MPGVSTHGSHALARRSCTTGWCHLTLFLENGITRQGRRMRISNVRCMECEKATRKPLSGCSQRPLAIPSGMRAGVKASTHLAVCERVDAPESHAARGVGHPVVNPHSQPP